MTFADRALARRLEAAEAANARGCAPAGAVSLEIAGGCAIFAGADSPLTQAVGIGLSGAVSEACSGPPQSWLLAQSIAALSVSRPTLSATMSATSLRAAWKFSACPVRPCARSSLTQAPPCRIQSAATRASCMRSLTAAPAGLGHPRPFRKGSSLPPLVMWSPWLHGDVVWRRRGRAMRSRPDTELSIY